MNWSKPVSQAEAYHRAGGRRHYNAWRRLKASYRRMEVMNLALKGMRKADIARALGVHRSTITRDYQEVWLLHLTDQVNHLQRAIDQATPRARKKRG